MSTGTTTRSKRRALPPEVRREQLVQATIRSIARRGLSGTTLAAVTREAGLSMGIANLHFESKDKLLAATLSHVADEYNGGLRELLDSGNPLAQRLQDLVDFDFSPSVARRDKLAVWFAFWGEAGARPTYRKICNRSDRATQALLRELFAEAAAQHPGHDVDLLTSGYTALANGLWLDLLVSPRKTSRAAARAIAQQYLRDAFPGLLPPAAA